MNTKRWIALVIALGLGIFSFTVPTRETEKEQTMTEALLNESILTENVIEQGTSDKKIVKLSIDGTIMANTSTSFFEKEGYNHQLFLEELEQIKQDGDVAGMLLEVNSPGGGVYESAEIARLIKAIQADRKIPLYVSMKGMAASGGYYVSASADKIYATEETMTGSIGVIMSNLNLAGLLDKLGVEDTTVKSGEMKDVGSTTRKWTDKDREVLQTMVDNSYNRFVKIVSEGRKMDEGTVKKIADGRIYDGEQAVENGLVDAIAYPDEVLAALKSENKLDNATVVEYQSSDNSLLSFLPFNVSSFFSKEAKSSSSDVALETLKKVTDDSTPRMMYMYGGE